VKSATVVAGVADEQETALYGYVRGKERFRVTVAADRPDERPIRIEHLNPVIARVGRKTRPSAHPR
jgi:hypothetical protein